MCVPIDLGDVFQSLTLNALVVQGLDFAVSEAKKYGIRLILCLVNNYADFGGKPQYVKWAKDYAGITLASDDSFFSDTTVKGWYKNHIRVESFTIVNITGKLLIEVLSLSIYLGSCEA